MPHRFIVALPVMAVLALAGCSAPPEGSGDAPVSSPIATVTPTPTRSQSPTAPSEVETTAVPSSYVNPRVRTTPDVGPWNVPYTTFPFIEPGSTDERYLHELQSRFGYMPLPYMLYGLDTAVRHAKEFCQLHLDYPDLSIDDLVYRFSGRFNLGENTAKVVIDVARWHYCADTWPHE